MFMMPSKIAGSKFAVAGYPANANLNCCCWFTDPENRSFAVLLLCCWQFLPAIIINS
jgi:hypothetical protein